jgi:hypothetical protein
MANTMITQEEILKQDFVMSLADRRAFLRMPIEERRRVLEIQAERMLVHYEQASESENHEAWQGGDIIEL